jgi:hypothetical protein
MNIQDEDLRQVLLARGNRSGWIDVERMVTDAMASSPASVTSKARPFLSALQEFSRGIVVVVAAVAVIGVGVALQDGAGSRPTGLWQSKEPVGTGAVGSATCVAIDLTADAYETGKVTVWWWAPGGGDCRSSSSGPMEAVATIDSVSLAVPGLGSQRAAYRVHLDLEVIGGGTERVEFVLDPFGRRAGAAGLAGFAGRDLSGRGLDFTQVSGLDVTPPGGVPAPTPEVKPG